MQRSNRDLPTADENILTDLEYSTGITNSCEYTWSVRSTVPLRLSPFKPL